MSKGGSKLENQYTDSPDVIFDPADCQNCHEQQSIQQTDFTCPPNTFAYIVQPGDTMFLIAQRFGVRLDALIAANPQIPDPSEIRPGQTVCVPQAATVCPPNTFAYIVQPGDTMFFIAQRFGVSLDALIAANPQIPNPNMIIPGQTVCVPTAAPPPPGDCPPNTFVYVVQPGDTMFFIAQRFGVSLNALIAANPQIPNPNLIFPGQRVCVPRVSAPPGCPPGSTRYTVQPGDSMFTIARRFGVSLDALIRANPQISNPSLIFPGQQLC
ncbi:MAG: SafA/ExsA family spore coat assembly protein, partial [Limnochordia bacterium]